jgi:hypothetical protein
LRYAAGSGTAELVIDSILDHEVVPIGYGCSAGLACFDGPLGALASGPSLVNRSGPTLAI